MPDEQKDLKYFAATSAAIAIAVVCLVLGWIFRAYLMHDLDTVREAAMQQQAVAMGYAEWIDHNSDNSWTHYREFRWKAKP